MYTFFCRHFFFAHSPWFTLQKNARRFGRMETHRYLVFSVNTWDRSYIVYTPRASLKPKFSRWRGKTVSYFASVILKSSVYTRATECRPFSEHTRGNIRKTMHSPEGPCPGHRDVTSRAPRQRRQGVPRVHLAAFYPTFLAASGYSTTYSFSQQER